MEKKNDYMEIDLLRFLQAVLKKLWLVVLLTVIGGALSFLYSTYLITPTYTARAMMYVNARSVELGGATFNLSASDLSGSQNIVTTYSIILKTRSNLEKVIEKADLKYSYSQLSSMISVASVSSTKIFSISVTSSDPEEAALIANTITQVLPESISDIIDDRSARTVDYAVVPTSRSGPNISKNTLIGLVLGAVLACGIIFLLDISDDVVHGSDFLSENFDIPVLAEIPDLSPSSRTNTAKKYSSYSTYGSYSDKSEKK